MQVHGYEIQSEVLGFAAYAALFDGKESFHDSASRESWSGASISDAARLLKHGDTSQVPRAERLQERFSNEYEIESPRFEMASDVVGAFPNVPAMLANVPENMMRPVATPSHGGEIVICAEQFISASFDKKEYERRGAALLALVQYLQAIRPVRLVVLSSMARDWKDNDAILTLVNLPANPLDIARAGFLLSHIAAYRTFGLQRYYDLGGRSTAPWRAGESDKLAILRRILDCENIILTPNLVSKSGESPFKSDASAAQWVQSKIDATLP